MAEHKNFKVFPGTVLAACFWPRWHTAFLSNCRCSAFQLALALTLSPSGRGLGKSSSLLASQEHFGRMLTRGFGNCCTPEHARNFFDTFLLAKHGDTA